HLLRYEILGLHASEARTRAQLCPSRAQITGFGRGNANPAGVALWVGHIHLGIRGSVASFLRMGPGCADS
ncbi:hypothetical protein C7212DRAFT_197347, partial [Tuber magnatum]